MNKNMSKNLNKKIVEDCSIDELKATLKAKENEQNKVKARAYKNEFPKIKRYAKELGFGDGLTANLICHINNDIRIDFSLFVDAVFDIVIGEFAIKSTKKDLGILEDFLTMYVRDDDGDGLLELCLKYNKDFYRSFSLLKDKVKQLHSKLKTCKSDADELFDALSSN